MSQKYRIIFEEIELQMMKELWKFVRQARYELTGEEMPAAASIMRWVEQLPKRAVPHVECEQKEPESDNPVRKRRSS